MTKIKDKFKSCPELFNAILFILGGCAVVFLAKNYFSIFAPFIIAYIVTQLLHPIMVKMRSKIKIPNILNTILCMIAFVTIAGFVTWIFAHYIIEGISYLINLFSSTSTIDAIVLFVNEIGSKFDNLTAFLGVDVNPNDITNAIVDFAKNAIQVLSNLSINFAMGIPGFLMSLIIGSVAAFYMLFDYEKISMEISKRLSTETKKIVNVFNKQVLSSFIKMIASYIVVSTICFCELSVGFLLLGIKDATFIAFIVAILDVLPILGSGAVLIPWGIVSILIGQPVTGTGILALWGVVTVVRQILEPKIVGSQIGLYPLITLASLYLGLKLMGGIGLIVGPLYVIICKKTSEENLIWMDTKADENSLNLKQDEHLTAHK